MNNIECWAVVEVVNDERVVLGVMRTPDAKARAEERAEQHRAEGKTVEVIKYDGKITHHY